MTALTGRQKKDTYKDLLQVSNSNQGIDTTLRTIEDGEGTQGPIQLSTTTFNVTGTLQKGGTTISATAAEVNALASVAAGTVSASKAVVVGADKNIDTIAIATGGLKIGSGAGTAVTATATEINTLASVTAGTAAASKAVVLDANKDVASLRDVTVRQTICTGGVGTRNSTYTSAVVEYGDGAIHKSVLTLAGAQFTITDDDGNGQYGGFEVYTFPAGNIVVLGATVDGDINIDGGFLSNATGEIALGSAAVNGGTTMSGTEVDIAAAADFGPLTGQAGTANTRSTASVTLNGTSSDAKVYVNVRLDDDAAHETNTSNTLSGTVTLVWVNTGDY